MSIQAVAEAKGALGRIQDFLEEKVSQSEETKQPNQNNTNRVLEELVEPGDNFVVQCEDTQKTVPVQLTSYRKRKYVTGENFQTFTSTSTTTTTQSPSIFSGSKAPYLSILEVSCSWNQD